MQSGGKPDKLSVDRGELLAKCAIEVQEWTEFDAEQLQQWLLAPFGRKLLGVMQLTQKQVESGLMAVKVGQDPAIVAAELARAQGRVAGFAEAIDELLNLCNKDEQNASS